MVGRAWLLGGTLALGGTAVSPAGAGDVAIIVHPSNPQGDMSSSDLLLTLKMERQHWAHGARIYVVLQESGAPEKDLVLKRLYRMKDADLKRHYLWKLYRGEIASFPRIAHSNAAARRLVSQAPNAISFVDASWVDATVKVVRIDGRRPGEAGYLLASGGEPRDGAPGR